MPFPKVNSQLKIVNRVKKSIYHLPFTIYAKGFTLIELLIVISIIGILASLTLASFSSAQAKARDGVRKSDIGQIKRALEIAKADCQGNAYYPVMAGADEYARFDNLQLYLGDTDLKYMSSVPDDPQNSTSSRYGYATDAAETANVCPNTSTPPAQTQSGSVNFMLRTLLERGTADSDSTKSFNQCTGKPGVPATAGGYYYACNN